MKIVIYPNIRNCSNAPILNLEIKSQEVIIPTLIYLETLAHCEYYFELSDDNFVVLVGRLNLKAVRNNIFNELVKEFIKC